MTLHETKQKSTCLRKHLTVLKMDLQRFFHEAAQFVFFLSLNYSDKMSVSKGHQLIFNVSCLSDGNFLSEDIAMTLPWTKTA